MDGVTQRILNIPIGRDLTLIRELSLTGQNSSIWFFVCLSWFFTSASTIFQSCRDGSTLVDPVLKHRVRH